MRLSDDKVRHITHLLLKGLLEKEAIAISEEEGTIRREMQRIILKELKLVDAIDEKVTKTLQSYSKKIYEGSSEWEVMYQKLFDQEASKKGRG